MNLADMLGYADIHDLSRIAHTYNCQCSGHSKNELIQSILATVSRRDVLEEQLNNLAIEDIRFLNGLIFDKMVAFNLEELVARVQQSRFTKSKDDEEKWNPREMISRFKQHGWLFNGFSRDTRYTFVVPADLKSRFSEVLAKRFQLRIVTSGEPSVYRDEQTLLIDDIRTFLVFVRDHEIMLTVEHFMYKRQLQHILELLAVKEAPVAKSAWRFGYGRMAKEYPNRFSFLYDYCYFNGWIVEDNQLLSLSLKGEQWIEAKAHDEILPIYRYWLRRYKGPIPNLQSLVYWLEKLVVTWVTVASIKEVLIPLIRPFYYDTADSILEQRILQMLMHLGLIRIGEHAESGTVIQLTQLGRSVIRGIYVTNEDLAALPIDKK